jgi:RNA polymerase sigma factor (sigma-70 family)
MTTLEFHYRIINLQESLMRFASGLTPNRDDAKDLVQETILKALKYCDSFVHETNLKAWTFTIMKNTFINHYNRNKRQNAYVNHTKEDFYQGFLHNTSADDPQAVVSSKELEKIIESLDDGLKVPFKMHHEGYKYKEIAEKLELKLGTVKSRIFSTRKILMEQFSEY